MKQFKGVYPISGEDLNALPVKDFLESFVLR